MVLYHRRLIETLGITMLSPSRISFVAGGSIATSIAISQLVAELVRERPPGAGASWAVETACLGGLFFGALVWLGTYAGAKLARPAQRTRRLAMWLAVGYLAIGILFSLPIKTHAVVIDLPRGGAEPDPSGGWFPLLWVLGPILIPVVISLILTRALAVMLVRNSRGNA